MMKETITANMRIQKGIERRFDTWYNTNKTAVKISKKLNYAKMAVTLWEP